MHPEDYNRLTQRLFNVCGSKLAESTMDWYHNHPEQKDPLAIIISDACPRLSNVVSRDEAIANLKDTGLPEAIVAQVIATLPKLTPVPAGGVDVIIVAVPHVAIIRTEFQFLQSPFKQTKSLPS